MKAFLVLLLIVAVGLSAQPKKTIAATDTLISVPALIKLVDAKIADRQRAVQQAKQQIETWEREILYLGSRRDTWAALSDSAVVVKKSSLYELK